MGSFCGAVRGRNEVAATPTSVTVRETRLLIGLAGDAARRHASMITFPRGFSFKGGTRLAENG